MNNIIKLGNTIVREIRVKTALSRSGLPEYDYALNHTLAVSMAVFIAMPWTSRRASQALSGGVR